MNRLARSTPRAAESFLAIAVGTFVAAAGTAVVIWVLYRFFTIGIPDKAEAMAATFCGGVALTGYAILGRGLYQWFGSRTPQPVVEIDREVLRPGDRVRVRFTQPGPARLDDLSLVLICEKNQFDPVKIERSDDDGRQLRPVKIPNWKRTTHQFVSIFHEENIRIPRGETFEREVTFELPAEAEPTVSKGETRYEWKFEAEAAPTLWANSVDTFPVTVLSTGGSEMRP